MKMARPENARSCKAQAQSSECHGPATDSLALFMRKIKSLQLISLSRSSSVYYFLPKCKFAAAPMALALSLHSTKWEMNQK
jgi:hypothetical protein